MINPEKIEQTKKLIYEPENTDSKTERIDKFLLQSFPEYSRAYFQKLIQEKLIIVNSKVNTKSSYKLRFNDTIEINFPETKQFDLSPKKIDFKIIDTQKDFVVINKPAGLIVHHSQKTQNDVVTLVNGLLYYFEELNKFSNKERPGIVHRIDKGTSGILLVARNFRGQLKLSSKFKNREIKKEYLAVVKGHPPIEGQIDLPIGRHPYKRHMMSHVSYRSKPSLSYYNVLAYYKDTSLVRVRIVTGRTHQIRVHMAAIGHGLIGDEIYGYNSKLILHPALHAWKVGFEYDNEVFNYHQTVPEDFNNLLKELNRVGRGD